MVPRVDQAGRQKGTGQHLDKRKMEKGKGFLSKLSVKEGKIILLKQKKFPKHRKNLPVAYWTHYNGTLSKHRFC
jgi:hypothetical protein